MTELGNAAEILAKELPAPGAAIPASIVDPPSGFALELNRPKPNTNPMPEGLVRGWAQQFVARMAEFGNVAVDYAEQGEPIVGVEDGAILVDWAEHTTTEGVIARTYIVDYTPVGGSRRVVFDALGRIF